MWEEITDKELWDKSLLNNAKGNFLQSFAYGEFNSKLGNKIWRLGKKEGENLSGLCLAIKLTSKSGSFLYIPGGPVLENWESYLPSLIKSLQEIAHSEKASFVRFDSREVSDQQKNILTNCGLKKAPYYTQPQCTLVLDLEKSEEDLRSSLSESTRYNVGWVGRQGVKVKVSENPQEIELFTKLLQETANRQGFRLTTNVNYYQEQFLAFQNLGQAKLYLTFGVGETAGEVIAAAIVIYFGKTATYLHAASSSKAPKLRAPYLQQWHIITDAKNAGFKVYDFWGVARDDNPSDPWAGVTTFKRSFGGERLGYEKPYDLIINQQGYYFNLFAERLRNFLKTLRH